MKNCIRTQKALEAYIMEEKKKLAILRAFRKNLSPGSEITLKYYNNRIRDIYIRLDVLKFSSFCVQFYIDRLDQL